MCAEVSDKALAVYRVQSNETCPSQTGTLESFHHLTESVDSVWKDVGFVEYFKEGRVGVHRCFSRVFKVKQSMGTLHRIHVNGGSKRRSAVFIFMASSDVFKHSSFLELKFDNRARCAFEGSWELMDLCEVYLCSDLPTLWGDLCVPGSCASHFHISLLEEP